MQVKDYKKTQEKVKRSVYELVNAFEFFVYSISNSICFPLFQIILLLKWYNSVLA